MYDFRVTKYDPARRDEYGRYLHADWTSFGDVGKTFDGRTLTLREYERVERTYVDAATCFVSEAGQRELHARGVENPERHPEVPEEGEPLAESALRRAFRDVLRGVYWCRFEGARGFVHFGWEHYMYIGVARVPFRAIANARAAGLFVEPFESPYREND
jgi:hypothetical protein